MKNGVPMREVIIPIGNSAGATTSFAPISEKTRNDPPRRKDEYISEVTLEPIIKRSRCGMTKPTNPIRPVNATTGPQISALYINTFLLTISISTPKAIASLSPSPNVSKSFDRRSKLKLPKKTRIKITRFIVQEALLSEPRDQKVIVLSYSSSAMFINKPEKAPAKAFMAIPERSIIAISIFPSNDDNL